MPRRRLDIPREGRVDADGAFPDVDDAAPDLSEVALVVGEDVAGEAVACVAVADRSAAVSSDRSMT
ncbi:hypothetical protein [Knoellia remsis]|uniref:hypothetical protein n=1 Tax=Knoellia remsis TaxID=407159 RepID=UPI0011B29362|nr:hypothetical protein [Knoellia remsis]